VGGAVAVAVVRERICVAGWWFDRHCSFSQAGWRRCRRCRPSSGCEARRRQFGLRSWRRRRPAWATTCTLGWVTGCAFDKREVGLTAVRLRAQILIISVSEVAKSEELTIKKLNTYARLGICTANVSLCHIKYLKYHFLRVFDSLPQFWEYVLKNCAFFVNFFLFYLKMNTDSVSIRLGGISCGLRPASAALSAKHLKTLEDLSRGIMNKMLHSPPRPAAGIWLGWSSRGLLMSSVTFEERGQH